MLKWLKRRVYDWDFSLKGRSALDSRLIFEQAFNLEGFKELLARDVYFFKRKFIESEKDVKSLYYAEAYQRLLDHMVESHRYMEEFKKQAELEKEEIKNS